jgi:hypothetical protein
MEGSCHLNPWFVAEFAESELRPWTAAGGRELARTVELRAALGGIQAAGVTDESEIVEVDGGSAGPPAVQRGVLAAAADWSGGDDAIAPFTSAI